jgi:hypothetical protein
MNQGISRTARRGKRRYGASTLSRLRHRHAEILSCKLSLHLADIPRTRTMTTNADLVRAESIALLRGFVAA